MTLPLIGERPKKERGKRRIKKAARLDFFSGEKMNGPEEVKKKVAVKKKMSLSIG